MILKGTLWLVLAIFSLRAKQFIFCTKKGYMEGCSHVERPVYLPTVLCARVALRVIPRLRISFCTVHISHQVHRQCSKGEPVLIQTTCCLGHWPQEHCADARFSVLTILTSFLAGVSSCRPGITLVLNKRPR